MVICLERGADLHTAQLMPLPLTVSCCLKALKALKIVQNRTNIFSNQSLPPTVSILTAKRPTCQGCSSGYSHWYFSCKPTLSTIFKYWYWSLYLRLRYLNWYLTFKYWYLYNNNNNNDRLTAFDPGQPG